MHSCWQKQHWFDTFINDYQCLHICKLLSLIWLSPQIPSENISIVLGKYDFILIYCSNEQVLYSYNWQKHSHVTHYYDCKIKLNLSRVFVFFKTVLLTDTSQLVHLDLISVDNQKSIFSCPFFYLTFEHSQAHATLWTTKFQSGQVNPKSYLPSLVSIICGSVCTNTN